MIREKGQFYMIMTSDPDLAKALREYLEGWKSVWWKIITRYYDGKSELPYHETSESSRGK